MRVTARSGWRRAAGVLRSAWHRGAPQKRITIERPIRSITVGAAQPEGRIAVLDAIGNGRRKLIGASAAVSVLLGLHFSTTATSAAEQPLESHLLPLSSVDLEAFSDRAAAWTEAHRQHRDDARSRALALAAQARAAESSATTTTVQAPATTTPPTTAVPSTTEAPVTTAPATTAPATTAPATAVPSTTEAPVTTAPATTVPGDDLTVTDTTPSVAPPTTAAVTLPTEAQWEALRQCESSGNYRAISARPAGRYRGAYQFSQSTWNGVATQIGADYLVGVDPAEASPADQDRMAKALWNARGWGPWPACSKMLGYL